VAMIISIVFLKAIGPDYAELMKLFSNFLYYFFIVLAFYWGSWKLCSLELGRLVTAISTPRQVERASVAVVYKYKVGL
jgi:hypothetical protein